jgi:hypothetical protein
MNRNDLEDVFSLSLLIKSFFLRSVSRVSVLLGFSAVLGASCAGDEKMVSGCEGGTYVAILR